MSTPGTTTTGPDAGNRGHHPKDIRMRVADLVGAYHRHEYHAMHTHSLALIAMARRLGADRNTTAQEVVDVPRAASELVGAWKDGRENDMSAIALGLLDVASKHKRGGDD